MKKRPSWRTRPFYIRRYSRPLLLDCLALIFFFSQGSYPCYVFVLVNIHELYALGVPANDRDALHRYPYDLPGAGGYHQLVGVPHLGDCGNWAVLFGYLDVDQAASAPVLAPVLGELGPLAVAALGHGKYGRALLDSLHRHDPVGVIELYALHAPGRTPHLPHLFLMEPYGLAHAGAEEQVGLAVREPGRYEAVPLVEVDGNETAGADMGEAHEVGLFHHAVRRRHGNEIPLLE